MNKPIKQAIREQEQRVINAEIKLDELKSKSEDWRGRKDEQTVLVTNEDLFLDLIENEDSMVVAMARTMLMQQADQLLSNRESVIESHKNSIVSGEYVIYCAQRVKELFNKE